MAEYTTRCMWLDFGPRMVYFECQTYVDILMWTVMDDLWNYNKIFVSWSVHSMVETQSNESFPPNWKIDEYWLFLS